MTEQPLIMSVSAAPDRTGQRMVANVVRFVVIASTSVVILVGAMLPRYTSRDGDTEALNYQSLASELADLQRHTVDSRFHQDVRVDLTAAVFDRGKWVDTVVYDTIAVVGTSRYPGLAQTGFLADQIALYNEHQRKRMEHLLDNPVSGRLPRQMLHLSNPSVLRTTRIVGLLSDSVLLAGRSDVSRMRVASPFEPLRTLFVTARDASRAISLVSPDGAAQLRTGGVTPGPESCRFTSDGRVSDFHCLRTALAGERGLRLQFTDYLQPTGKLIALRGTNRYEGRRVAPRETVDVSIGGIVRMDAGRGRHAGPFILENTVGGAIAGTQWVNGSLRWRANPAWANPFSRQIASSVSFGGIQGLLDGAVLSLSLDEGLTQDLQRRLRQFTDTQSQTRTYLKFATVVLADLRSGEILAVGELNRADPEASSWLLRPVNVGSAIKPIMAAAILSRRPELGTLELPNVPNGGDMTSLWGLPLGKPFHAGCAAASRIGLRTFIACSSNLFAAHLVAAGLAPDSSALSTVPSLDVRFWLNGKETRNERPFFPLTSAGVAQSTLAGSTLAAGLLRLDSLTTVMEHAEAGGIQARDERIWEGLRDPQQSGVPVRMPSTMWLENSRIAVASKDGVSSLRALAGYAIGTGENQITPVSITEAFARIVSDHPVRLTLVPRSSSMAVRNWGSQVMGYARQPWYPALLGGLHDVTNSPLGTARIVAPAMQRVFPNLVMLAKTGTINEDGDTIQVRQPVTVVVDGKPEVRFRRQGLLVDPVVAKSFLFAIGRPASNGSLSCGVVGFVYFRLSEKVDEVDPLAAGFVASELLPSLGGSWKRLGIC